MSYNFSLYFHLPWATLGCRRSVPEAMGKMFVMVVCMFALSWEMRTVYPVLSQCRGMSVWFTATEISRTANVATKAKTS